jgi:CheY-like chemotaxis protein
MEKTRVLIVDDDIETSYFLREDLEKSGMYEVFEEFRGARALEAIRTLQPNIVLLDIMIPDLDGPSIAAKIEEEKLQPGIKIVFLSSIISTEEAERGSIGGYPFLSKDSSSEQIKRFLDKLAA